MKILVVDDAYWFVERILSSWRNAGLEGRGLTYDQGGWWLIDESGHGSCPSDLPTLFQEVEVIFLDDRMPMMSGEELLVMLQDRGVPLHEKRVIGISCGDQTYVKEHVNSPGMITYPHFVKKLLGIN